jgi:folate-dependent phosphoribosylglycinamide formyltransferase PurN
MSALRLVVAVSRDRSDLYFANQVARRLNVVGVLVENQVAEPNGTPAWRKALQLIAQPQLLAKRLPAALVERWRARFAIYNRAKHLTDFGKEGLELAVPSHISVLQTRGVNAINAPEYISWLRNLAPDVIAVCGTSLMRQNFLAVPKQGVLNLHGGLAQRYRGLNTTDWCVHNGEPEYIGATVHFVTSGIDNGRIVYQGRPAISANDTPNTLYVKVVKLGVEMMEAAVRDLESGTLQAATLETPGTLYLGKQFTHRARIATWRQYKRGVVADYIANKAQRDAHVDAIMINEFKGSSGFRRRQC